MDFASPDSSIASQRCPRASASWSGVGVVFQAQLSRLGTDTTPVISEEHDEMIRQHFRSLPWLEFIADTYLCVEALGSEAVENIVPLADPGTRDSLHIPLSDEQDHIAFGINRLRQELAELPVGQREDFLASIPSRIDWLTDAFHGLGLDVAHLFGNVGADCRELCNAVLQRRDEILNRLAA
jgi:hypothetical protein